MSTAVLQDQWEQAVEEEEKEKESEGMPACEEQDKVGQTPWILLIS